LIIAAPADETHTSASLLQAGSLLSWFRREYQQPLPIVTDGASCSPARKVLLSGL
jgi:hypothetical protein